MWPHNDFDHFSVILLRDKYRMNMKGFERLFESMVFIINLEPPYSQQFSFSLLNSLTPRMSGLEISNEAALVYKTWPVSRLFTKIFYNLNSAEVY